MWCTPWSLTPWYDAHCGAWLLSVMHTAKFVKKLLSLDSAVWITLWSLTSQWDAHCGVWLRGVMHTVEWRWAICSGCSPKMSKLVIFLSKLLIRSLIWQKTSDLLRNSISKFPTLTSRYIAHHGVWLRVGCTLWSFLKIPIFRQNQNPIRKYLSLFIRGLDGFKSWKKRFKISWHTPFKYKKNFCFPAHLIKVYWLCWLFKLGKKYFF